MWNAFVIGLLAAVVATLLWRHNQSRVRLEREREERRARTDQLLARALVGEDRAERHTIGGEVTAIWPLAAEEPPAKPAAVDREPVVVDILLDGESNSVIEQARRQLDRPTTLALLSATESAAARAKAEGPASALALLDGKIEVPLDSLVVAWFQARGYVSAPAPTSVRPIRLLMTHRDDSERSYAFYFDRGRLHAQRAAELLEKARALGMHRLLVAAEHGADQSVNSSRLRDVLVMDWVALDREVRKLDFRIAAKLVAIARTRRSSLGLD